MKKRYFLLLVLLASPLLVSAADIDIVLNNDFIEEYKNKILISGTFTFIEAGPIHNATKFSTDGDVHASGDFPESGFATVAELMNANFNDDAANTLLAGGDINMTGVWRLWCEHAEQTHLFTQGSPAPIAADDSNPNHVFEIHPITSMNNDSFAVSVSTIQSTTENQEYEAYPEVKFIQYQRRKFRIIPNQDKTTLRTTQIGYNYVKFRIKIRDEPPVIVPGEGRFVFASVLNDNFEQVELDKRRMVFIEGTDAEATIKTIQPGGVITVLGIPRINLAIVSWRAKNPTWNGKNTLIWNLPYEMIVVGVY